MSVKIKNYILPFVFMLASTILLGFSFYSSSAGVYCKDCGSEDNCWVGSGLDTGYQDCFINEDGECSVSVEGWGDCQAYPNLTQKD